MPVIHDLNHLRVWLIDKQIVPEVGHYNKVLKVVIVIDDLRPCKKKQRKEIVENMFEWIVYEMGNLTNKNR